MITSSKSRKAEQAARIATQRSSVYDENGRKQVGTVIRDAQDGESRKTKRHPYSFRCTLHTKKWTKYRVDYYANMFGQAVNMKASKTPMKKKSFVHSLINLFA